MKNIDRARAMFQQGYNCSQVVLAACGPGLGLDEASCLKVSAAFGGGMCRSAGTCGAVTGGLMAVGLRYGGVTIADPSRKADVYARGQDFLARFRAKHGSIVCRDLLGCDLSTPAGLQQAKEQNLHEEVCSGLVCDAVAILNEMP
jgi:C_GCAxxG_C_C family probable redox protein